MTSNADGFRGRTVAATFAEPEMAKEAADRLTQTISGIDVLLKPKKEARKVQQAEMREELEGVVGSPALGSVLTKSQTQGAVGGTVLVGGLAVLIGVVIGFIVQGTPGQDVSWARWLLMWVLTPAIAGGTLGMLAGGLIKQRYRPAPTDVAPPREASPRTGLPDPSDCVVEVSAREESSLQQAVDLLQKLNPERLDRFSAEGEVVETEDLGRTAQT